MSSSSKCGFCGFYPKWLQNWATTRNFILIYSFLGTIQAMAGIYIGTSISTLERRFKIPSLTTGLLFSGSDISQFLSIFLIYYGGTGHRPRWIAVGLGFSAISCLILTLPHVIYGPGQDALALTKEFINVTLLMSGKNTEELPICSKNSRPENCVDDNDFTADTSIVPRLLVFFSQFILGIGGTLYYCLGQTYMDDNTNKKNTPMVLGFISALQMIGPAFGYLLGYLCLNIYIDPSLHPVINNQDPRWLGAWWLGLIILSFIMAIFAVLLSMFPPELRKSKMLKEKKNVLIESENRLSNEVNQLDKAKNDEASLIMEKPTLKEFPKSIMRILKNKLLMFNWLASIFYNLSASHYIIFKAKYLEVQYQSSPGGSTVINGPLRLLGMVFGYSISGFVIGKFKPEPRPLLLWNVVIGVIYCLGMLSFMFLGCESGKIQGIDFDTRMINLTAPCNAACNCQDVKYSPVCHEASKTTFISACHAGCTAVIDESTFGQCSCIAHLESTNHERNVVGASLRLTDDAWKIYDQDEKHVGRRVTAGPCKEDCFVPWMWFTVVMTLNSIFACTGSIGSILLNYRTVENRDKSLSQGLAGLVFSVLAFIPGSIIFGAIMDSTCLVWNLSCQKEGNCWFYHRENFRYYLNGTGAGLCVIGIFFDIIVCYLAKDIDLYGDKEKEEYVELSSDEPKQLS